MSIIDRNSAKAKIYPLSRHLWFCDFPCWYVTWAQIVKLHSGISSRRQKVPGPKDKIISGFAIPLFAPNKTHKYAIERMPKYRKNMQKIWCYKHKHVSFSGFLDSYQCLIPLESRALVFELPYLQGQRPRPHPCAVLGGATRWWTALYLNCDQSWRHHTGPFPVPVPWTTPQWNTNNQDCAPVCPRHCNQGRHPFTSNMHWPTLVAAPKNWQR